VIARPFELSAQQRADLFSALTPVPRRGKANAKPPKKGASVRTAEKYAPPRAPTPAPKHSEADKARFAAWVEGAIGAYLAGVKAMPDAKPRAVREQLAAIVRQAKGLARSREKLSSTALALFPNSDVLRSVPALLAGAEAAFAKSKLWADGRLTDYPKLALARKVGHFLRDELKVALSPTRAGVFGRCVEVALGAAGLGDEAALDFSSTLKRAIKELHELPTLQEIFLSNAPP